MKRTLIRTALCALSLAIAPARAVETLPAPEPSTSGTIQVPAGMSRAQRCAHGTLANGTFGWVLSVTAGYTFTLTTPAPSLDDVNIGFYTSLTPCASGAAIAGSYTNAFGNEGGTVPTGATKAIIYTGSVPNPPDHLGYARPNTAFTYTQAP